MNMHFREFQAARLSPPLCKGRWRTNVSRRGCSKFRQAFKSVILSALSLVILSALSLVILSEAKNLKTPASIITMRIVEV